MFKAIILLKRKDSATADEFREWWLNQHAPKAKQLPDVRKAVFNLVDTDANVDAEYDGVSELWFDTRQAFEAAYQSDIGKAVAADSMDNVSRRERLLVSEHVIVS